MQRDRRHVYELSNVTEYGSNLTTMNTLPFAGTAEKSGCPPAAQLVKSDVMELLTSSFE